MKFSDISKGFEEYCDEQFLGLFRIMFCTFFLLFNGMYKYDFIDVTPYELLHFASVMNFLGAYPSAFVLNTLQGVLFVAVFAVLLGWQTRFFSVLAFVLFVFTFSAPFSLGASSTPIYVYFTFLVFAFSSWGNKFSIDELTGKRTASRKLDKIVVLIYLLTFTEGFFMSGLSKALGGWFSWQNQAVLTYWNTNELWTLRTGIINTKNFTINSRFFWEVADYVIVICEMAPFLLFWNKKWLKISLFTIGTFHIFVWFFFEICFSFFPLMYVFYVINPLYLKEHTSVYAFLEKAFSRNNLKHIQWFGIIATTLYLLLYINRNIDIWYIVYELDYVIGMFCSYLVLIYAATTNFNKR